MGFIYIIPSNKRIRAGYRLIWKARNDRIFNNGAICVEDIVEKIKVLSCRWSICRMNIPPCLFYEWCCDPRVFFEVTGMVVRVAVEEVLRQGYSMLDLRCCWSSYYCCKTQIGRQLGVSLFEIC